MKSSLFVATNFEVQQHNLNLLEFFFIYRNNIVCFLHYRQFYHYHHGLRMWCDYLRCLHSFLKIEVDLCFKFDLRGVLDIRDFLKETTCALKLRFDCSTIKLRKSISKTLFNGMSKVDWFNFTLINFSVNTWDTLMWAHQWPYEPIDHLIWAHPCALRLYRRSECVC